MLLQFGFVSSYLVPSEWFSDSLIYSDDFILHYASTVNQNRYIDDYGRMWAYDPSFRAGTITLSVLSISSKGWGIFSRILSHLISYEAGFKLYFVLGLLLFPFVLYSASKKFGLNDKESILSVIAGTVYLQSSICVNFISWGTVSFIFVSFLSLLTVSFLYSYLECGKIRDLLLFTLFCCITLWIHALGVLCVGIPAFFITVYKLKSCFLKKMICLVLSALFVLLICWQVYFPLIFFYKFRIGFFGWIPHNSLDLWGPVKTYIFLSPFFNEYWGIVFEKNTLVDVLILCFSILGFCVWEKNGMRRGKICLLGTFFFFFFLSFYGSFFDLTRILTPLRFLITMNIFLSISAGRGMLTAYNYLASKGSKGIKTGICLVSLFIVMSILATPYFHLYILKSFRLNTDKPPGASKLVRMINDNTSNDGRILMENSDWESDHLYFGGHFPVMLPFYCDREFIGCDWSTDPMNDNFSTFWGGFLFHKKLEWFNREKIEEYFNLYNIKWVICWSKDSNILMNSFPDYISKRAQSGLFVLYEVLRKGDYFIKGKGKVSASTNFIRLSDLSADNGEIILSYHWMKTLKTDCGIPLIKDKRLDVPLEFIKLINPPENLTIYNAY